MFWSHAKNDPDWSLSSYVKIEALRSIEDFWGVWDEYVSTRRIKWFIFYYYFMFDDIVPSWEDPQNSNGLRVVMKTNNVNAMTLLQELLMGMCGNYLIKDPTSKIKINGLEVQMRYAHTNFKLWLSNVPDICKFEDIMVELPHVNWQEVEIRKN